MDAKIKAELEKPLDRANVKPPPKGKYGEYIEGWKAIEEANKVFGFDGWSYVVKTLNRTNAELKDGKHHVGYACCITVSALGVTREDYGHGQGHHSSEGEAHDSAIKEAVTDALKRALRTFGYRFGLALYDKSKANVSDDPDFDAKAAADEVIAAMTATKTTEALKSVAGNKRPTVEKIRAASQPDFERVISTYTAQEAKLSTPTPPKQVAAE